MAMNVWIELKDGVQRDYKDVTRVDDSDRDKVIIYKNGDVLAMIEKRQINKLLTEGEGE